MFNFMDEQSSLTSNFKKDIAKLNEEMRRKSSVVTVTTNGTTGTLNSGIRFSRSSASSMADSQGKSYYS